MNLSLKKILLATLLISTLLSAGHNGNTHSHSDGEKEYLEALYDYDLQKVKKALSAGVDINLRDGFKEPPLIKIFTSIALIQYDEEKNDRYK